MDPLTKLFLPDAKLLFIVSEMFTLGEITYDQKIVLKSTYLFNPYNIGRGHIQGQQGHILSLRPLPRQYG